MDNPSLPDLAARLQTLEDERDILQTLNDYCHFVDYHMEREWVDLFTADAVYDVRYRQPEMQGARIVGQVELARRVAGARGKLQKHLMSMPRIAVSGESAQAESYLTVLMERGGVPWLWRFGRFRDRLVKLQGRWLFQERIIEVDLTTSEV